MSRRNKKEAEMNTTRNPIGERLSAEDIEERIARFLMNERNNLGEFSQKSDSDNPFLQEIIRRTENTFGKQDLIYHDTTADENYYCIIDDSSEAGLFYILHRLAKKDSSKVGFDNYDEKAMSAIVISKDFHFDEAKIRACTGFVEDRDHFIDESKPRTYSFFCEVMFSYGDEIRTPYKLVLKGDIPYQGSMAARSAKFLEELEYRINDAIESIHERGFLSK
ncbi:hypothetical protein KY334_06585 [Candidatus Woesearchaeota archaeon]|nr:hypothetical protein [Candidatus Woesearchaeota archaeon]